MRARKVVSLFVEAVSEKLRGWTIQGASRAFPVAIREKGDRKGGVEVLTEGRKLLGTEESAAIRSGGACVLDEQGCFFPLELGEDKLDERKVNMWGGIGGGERKGSRRRWRGGGGWVRWVVRWDGGLRGGRRRKSGLGAGFRVGRVSDDDCIGDSLNVFPPFGLEFGVDMGREED